MSESEHVWINIILENELEPRLLEYRTPSLIVPALSYRAIAHLLDGDVGDAAAKSGAPTRPIHPSSVRRWCLDIYGIGNGHR